MDKVDNRKDNDAVWAETNARRASQGDSGGGSSGLLSKADNYEDAMLKMYKSHAGGKSMHHKYGEKCCPYRHAVWCGKQDTCDECPNGVHTDPDQLAKCKKDAERLLSMSGGTPFWVLLVASIVSFVIGFGVSWAVGHTGAGASS